MFLRGGSRRDKGGEEERRRGEEEVEGQSVAMQCIATATPRGGEGKWHGDCVEAKDGEHQHGTIASILALLTF